MKKTEAIFKDFGGEPNLIPEGSDLVGLGSFKRPPQVACRVVAEDVYQALVAAADEHGRSE